MRTTSFSLATLALLGCGSPSATPSVESANETPGPTQPQAAPPAPAAFDVHEWGLIDVYTDGQIELAAGPGSAASQPAVAPTQPAYRPPMPMRKPVVYFHLAPEVQRLDVRLEVHIAGTMIETWPTPTSQVGADQVVWQGALTQCPEGAHSAANDSAVQNARANCQTPDHVCEVADLPTYETSDGACVEVGAQTGRFLFYRGDLPHGTTFPIAVSPQATLALSTALDHPVFLVSEGAGSMHEAHVGELALPTAQGAQPNLPRADSLIAPFTAELIRAGLTADEARAFMAAWSASLFGGEEPAQATRRDRAVPPPEGTLLYFLPRADIERLAPMTITPTPRSLERVMVVRQHFAL